MKTTLYTMIKVYIFNKSNNVSRFNIFKKFLECVNSKISLTCCTKTDAVYQNVLDSKRRMAKLTFWLIEAQRRAALYNEVRP